MADSDPLDPSYVIIVALEQWVKEVDARDMSVEAISLSLKNLCQDFEIPEDVARHVLVDLLD